MATMKPEPPKTLDDLDTLADELEAVDDSEIEQALRAHGWQIWAQGATLAVDLGERGSWRLLVGMNGRVYGERVATGKITLVGSDLSLARGAAAAIRWLREQLTA